MYYHPDFADKKIVSIPTNLNLHSFMSKNPERAPFTGRPVVLQYGTH